jgi:hypothetical protein
MVRFCVSTARGSACAALSRGGPGPPPCVSARPFPVAQVRSALGCRERLREAPRRVHAVRAGVGPTVIFFRAENSHCRVLVRWNGHAQEEAGAFASSPGACCSWRRPERRRVQGPWEQILGRGSRFWTKIRFHGPCAVTPRAVQVARAGAPVGSGAGRAGGRARPGGRGGTVKIENRPQQKICFVYTLYFSKTQIRIAIPFF